MKYYATIIVAISAIFCFFLFDSMMSESGWASGSDGEFRLVAQGWKVFLVGWPLVFFGALFGGWLVFICMPWAAIVEQKTAPIVEQSEKKVEEARTLAIQHMNETKESAEAKQYQTLRSIEARESVAEKKLAEAHRIQIESTKIAEQFNRLQRKQENASHGFARLKKKLEKNELL